LGCYNLIHPLPPGVSYEGPERSTTDLQFLADLTWVDGEGVRHVDQTIFDTAFEIIREAERFVIVDMFLYNDFQGEEPETTRALSAEFTETLIARKRERPELIMVVISDPVNTVYGGVGSTHFDALEAAGIPVVITRLDKLRDSNPGYSGFWRLLARPLGRTERGLLPSPFSDDRVSILSYLELLNFKANHRKVVVADRGDGAIALVTSANPHDGSSAHGNVALVFGGAAAVDLLKTEQAVMAFSGASVPEISVDLPESTGAVPSIQVVTEGKIRKAILSALKSAGEGDSVDLAVFYLSDHSVVGALCDAKRRGAEVRVLLDPNKDAFGHEKNGIPNRPVAADLRDNEVDVRWCNTHGEQCHAKLMLVRYAKGDNFLLVGSANFTRRNLQDFNLETNVVLRGPDEVPAIRDAREYLERVWANEPDRFFSVDYDVYADEALRKRFLYEVEERTGLSTF
jgi:hypothetical protein